MDYPWGEGYWACWAWCCNPYLLAKLRQEELNFKSLVWEFNQEKYAKLERATRTSIQQVKGRFAGTVDRQGFIYWLYLIHVCSSFLMSRYLNRQHCQQYNSFVSMFFHASGLFCVPFMYCTADQQCQDKACDSDLSITKLIETLMTSRAQGIEWL